MPARLFALAIDANDPVALARFWADALRWEVGDDGTTVLPSDGTRFHIEVVHSPAPKRTTNQVHLDLTTSTQEDQDESVRMLVERGARHIDIGQGDEPHVVLADPEGNELCIIEPTNRFLSTCDRLGSITCNGSREVGVFWAAALGWPLAWDQDGETAVRAPDDIGPFVTWGPPVPTAGMESRLRLVVEADDAEVDRLLALGATRHAPQLLRDPDGTVFEIRSC